MYQFKARLRRLFPLEVQHLATRPSYDEAIAYANQALQRGRVLIEHRNGSWQVSRVGR